MNEDSWRVRERLGPKESRDFVALENAVQKWVRPRSRVDSLIAFLLNDRNKTRALAWLKDNPFGFSK